MDITDFQLIEKYMLECMQDSAHDKEHIYRVLYVALDIAEQERHVDYDVLIAACLLHDIGRQEQFENPSLCHAVAGAERARKFLLEKGFPEKFADKVSSCIKAHRFRSSNPPVKTEEKILFDSDKIDATGTLGIARTIFYKGQTGEPLYSRNSMGESPTAQKIPLPPFFRNTNISLRVFTLNSIPKEEKKLPCSVNIPPYPSMKTCCRKQLLPTIQE